MIYLCFLMFLMFDHVCLRILQLKRLRVRLPEVLQAAEAAPASVPASSGALEPAFGAQDGRR